MPAHILKMDDRHGADGRAPAGPGQPGVAETTHAQNRGPAQAQSSAAKDKAMQHHIEEGTRGVTPHEMKPKKKDPKKGAGQSDAMQQHMEEGTKGVTPHAVPQKDK